MSSLRLSDAANRECDLAKMQPLLRRILTVSSFFAFDEMHSMFKNMYPTNQNPIPYPHHKHAKDNE